jgi:uncharacterized paraquat-inducible protein A
MSLLLAGQARVGKGLSIQPERLQPERKSFLSLISSVEDGMVAGINQSGNHCPTCKSELRQKNRITLFAAGVALLMGATILFFVPFGWLPAVLLILIGGYLLAWSTIGTGQWCRQCKRFVALKRQARGQRADL